MFLVALNTTSFKQYYTALHYFLSFLNKKNHYKIPNHSEKIADDTLDEIFNLADMIEHRTKTK